MFNIHPRPIGFARSCVSIAALVASVQAATAQPQRDTAVASDAGASLVAQAAPQRLAPVEITGNYQNAVGTTDAASAGTVTSKLIESRPILRPAEVLEFIPGLIVTQHSGD